MSNYFNINFQFNHIELEEQVRLTAKESKGYFCFVDLTSLVSSYMDLEFRRVLNSSTANSCDGSYIALMVSEIHSDKVKEYIGPDFFKKFIYCNNKQLIIGNTEVVFNKIKSKVEIENNHANNLYYLPVPYLDVSDFDYEQIGKIINKIKPDYIWVSLGAPKQEIFMSKLIPYVNRGALLGIGAATNYFSGEIKDIPSWAKKLHLIWLYRIFTEPNKQLKRLKSILLTFPKMIKEEKNRIKNLKL